MTAPLAGDRVGILGGTLDPVHVGHVETALAARRALALSRVLVMPARVPPHRPQSPAASGYHRFAMAAMAVSGIDGLTVSDAELCAAGPSYTATTLQRLHGRGFDPLHLFFITGADAFAEIATWFNYPAVLDLAHFVVVSRPGVPAASMTARVPDAGARYVPPGESRTGGPWIFLVDTRTPDVSSTEVRRRVRAGESIEGLVAPAVEWHIRRHRLYLEDGMTDTTAAGE